MARVAAILFTTDKGMHRNEPWKTNRTEAGTVMAKDINPGWRHLMHKVLTILLAIVLLSPMMEGKAQTREESPLTRDEVVAIKKKVIAVFDAAGQPPEGYVMKEFFGLPTDVSVKPGSGKFRLLQVHAWRRFGDKAEKARKDAEQVRKDDAQRRQKEQGEKMREKMREAMAKNDGGATMRQLSLEMQQLPFSEAEQQETPAPKQPSEIHIAFNQNARRAIDPDLILFEKPGVIAFKGTAREGLAYTGREPPFVEIYFDPVSLKNSKQLSKVEFKEPQDGVGKKDAMLFITIELSGPLADIEAWAKRVNVNSVLAQIGSGG